MSFQRYPNTATLSVATTAGTLNSSGVYSPGLATSVVLNCRIESEGGGRGGGRYVIGTSGDRIDIADTLYCPFTSLVIPAGSVIQYLGGSRRVVQAAPRQKFTEILCT